MRILHVNKFLYRRGGAEAYMQDLAALQAGHGDEVEFFGMAHPENDHHTYEASFPPYLELNPPPPSLTGKLSATRRMIHSPVARRGMQQILDAVEPDVVHLHNIYSHLSPSILRPVAERRVPVVMTLHDYKLACPTYQLLSNGEICDACIGGGYRQAVKRRCNRGSLVASAVSALENVIHEKTGAYGPIHAFICPSDFLAATMKRAGVFPDRLHHVPHFVDLDSTPAKTEPGGPVVFAGRIAHEKGLDVLIEAIGKLPDAELVIAGDGPLRAELEALANERAPGRIRFLGRLDRTATLALIRQGSMVVVPSVWHENQPIVVLEAMASGTPVVSTDLGGLPELVRPGVSGVAVPPRDVDALAGTIDELLGDLGATFELGQRARVWAAEEFSPDLHRARVAAVYEVARAAR